MWIWIEAQWIRWLDWMDEIWPHDDDDGDWPSGTA